jgi:LSU ribosomal protein LX
VQIRIREASVVPPEEVRSEELKLLMAVDKVIKY